MFTTRIKRNISVYDSVLRCKRQRGNMKSALVLLTFGAFMCAALKSTVVINRFSCGSEYTIGEQDEITLNYDGSFLPEKCRLHFKKMDTLTGDICFSPTVFDVDRYSWIRVEYYRFFVGHEPFEELSFAASPRWCDSAHDIYVVFVSGNNTSPDSADIKIVVQLNSNTGVPDTALSNVAIGIIVTVAVLVVVAGILVVTFYVRRQRNRNRQPCTTTTSSYPMTQNVYPSAPTYTSQAADQPQNDYQTSTQAGYQPQYDYTTSTQTEYRSKYDYASSIQAGCQPHSGYSSQTQGYPQAGYPSAQIYPSQSGYQPQAISPAEPTETTSRLQGHPLYAQTVFQTQPLSPSLIHGDPLSYNAEYLPHYGIQAPRQSFTGNQLVNADPSDPPPPYSP